MKAFNKAKKVVYFNENLYHYRITNTQISSGNRYIHDTITPFNELLKELESFKDKVSDKRSFEEVFMVRVIGVLLWHLDHKYFHKEYKASIFKKRKSIIEIMNKEPYSRALKEVDITKLGKRAKLAVILFQKNMVLLFVLISRLNSLIRKFKR